jgi:hypothetical protein
MREQATKAKVQRTIRQAPTSFKKFFQSEEFDALTSTCLSYFIAGFTFDATRAALTKAKKQHQDGIKEPMVEVCPVSLMIA